MRKKDDWERQGIEGVRTSPTGRVPRWVLDEALDKPISPEPWRAWSPAGTLPRRGRWRRRLEMVGGLAVVVVLVVAGMVLQREVM